MYNSIIEISDTPDVSLTQLKNKIEFVISKFSQYLDPNKVYSPTDAEWDLEPLPRFKNWLQSSNIIFFPRKEGESVIWDYHIFIFNSISISEKSRQMIKNYFTDDKVSIFDTNEPIQYDVVEKFLKDENIKVKNGIQSLAKFSPLDYHAYFGTDVWIDELVKGKLVEQKRCLRFNTGGHSKRKYTPVKSDYSYTLRDIQGLNSSSLKVQAESVGVQLLAKDTMDDFKLTMGVGYEKKPITATIYNLCDVLGAFEIMVSYIPLINDIKTNVIGLPKHCEINESGLRHTTGSLAGNLLTDYIEYFPYLINPNVSEDDLDTWRLALRRLSIIKNDLNTEDTKLAGLVFQGLRDCKTVTDYKNYTITYQLGKKRVTKSLYELLLNDYTFTKLIDYKTFEQCCVRYIGSDDSVSLIYGALVQGGRCNNSFPYKAFLNWILDVDLASCYGSTLRSLHYPVGLPSTRFKGLSEGVKLENFKKVYDELSSELVDRCWVADVSTTELLSFDQDLIFSSLDVNPLSIVKAVGGNHYDDEGFQDNDLAGDVKKIPSTFSLERNRIVHGKITSQTMELINKVASNAEKSELWKKLELNNIIYYSRKDEIDNPIDWAREILSNPGEIIQDGHSAKLDNRSRKWFPLPLENLIGKLVDKRGRVKKQMKDSVKGSVEYINFKAIQEMLKLFVNTTYGDLASVYFPFGNVVLANVITDKARCGAWMLSKALRTMQEITDGGFYSPLEVAFIEGKKLPGFHIFSDSRRWIERKGKDVQRVTGSLGGLDWENLINQYADDVKNNEKDNVGKFNKLIDKLVVEHLDNFWSLYSLEFPFNIEHKYEHTGYSVGFMNKSDYAIYTVQEEVLVKKRGARPLSDFQRTLGLKEHPHFSLLKELALTGKCDNYVNSEYNSTHIIKVGEWIKTTEGSDMSKLYPGQELLSLREPPQMNNKHIYRTSTITKGVESHLTNSIEKRKGIVRKERIQWFERYLPDIDKYLQMCAENKLK